MPSGLEAFVDLLNVTLSLGDYDFMMKTFFLYMVAIMIVMTSSAMASMYECKDKEGTLHYTDALDKSLLRLCVCRELVSKVISPPAPTPGPYIYRVVAKDGSFWAVRTTNRQNHFYWYLGDKKKTLYWKTSPYVLRTYGFKYMMDHGEVLVTDEYGQNYKDSLLEDTFVYEMFQATVNAK